MAIAVEVIESKGTVREAGRNAQAFITPFVAVSRLAAAGDVQLNAATELISVINRGDAVYMRVTLVANNGSQPAGNNAFSIYMATGDSIPCGLDPNVTASLYNIRIVAG